MPSSTRTPPKRTRRVTAPFDARLEVRLYSTELAELRKQASDRGLSASDLVRFQLGDLIAAAPPNATESPDQGDGAASEPPTDLVQAIAEHCGGRGKALLKIRLGKVTVNGEPWTHEEIPPDLLEFVLVDGLPVRLPDEPGQDDAERQ